MRNVPGRSDLDELAQVSRQFLQEQHQVPSRPIVQERHRWDEQRLGLRRATNESGRRSSHVGIEETPRTTIKSQRGACRGLPQIQQEMQVQIEFEDGALDGERTQRRVLSLAEVARELRKCDASVRSEVQGWIANLVPAIVAHAARKAGVKDIEGRVCGDVPNADAAPRPEQSGEIGQLGTPSYVDASSAYTRSIWPRSMSCSAVRPPKTGSGVAMKRANPSGE